MSTLIVLLAAAITAAEPGAAAADYQIYAGNTHSHSQNTWSHGGQYATAKREPGAKKKPTMFIKNGVSYPSEETKPRDDWQKTQGPPAAHYALAKKNGYDFYAVTDHSQESTFHPTSPSNPAWLASKKEAAEATDADFVALDGYEHSENDGPGGKGHLNVYNSREYLNALSPGVDLPRFYEWLKTAAPNGDGPVVACFNHPSAHGYNGWDHRDAEVTEIITLLEMVNSNSHVHYDAFLNALDKGWKVSPVCGNDNHSFWGIAEHSSRTFVLARGKTKAALLDAMKNRRTYAAMDNNLQCRYTVNGAIMGSTLDRPEECRFVISTSDPDTDKAADKITKIDIVTDGGAVVDSYSPQPTFSVTWKPVIKNSTSRYFFVRVWNAGGGPEGKPHEPVAWLAPVWTGRDND